MKISETEVIQMSDLLGEGGFMQVVKICSERVGRVNAGHVRPAVGVLGVLLDLLLGSWRSH